MNLKKVLSHESSMELDNRYIPYHNDFIKLLEGEIVLNEKVEEIKGFYSELMFQDYLALDDNTYLLFYDNKTLNYSIYDIKNREFKNTGEKNYSKYQDGFIFYDDNHYQIYNLKDNVERRYLFKNTIEEELYYYYSYFTSSRDNIVQYNDRKNILEIINLKSNQIYGLDFSNYSMGKISGLSMNNNLLYLSVYNDRTDIDEFFIIDIQKLLEKGLDVDTYIKKFTDNQEKKLMIKLVILKINTKLMLR